MRDCNLNFSEGPSVSRGAKIKEGPTSTGEIAS